MVDQEIPTRQASDPRRQPRSADPPPVDWKNPDFYDEGKCLAEMERIFDICHGCRRCVSLCQSFPNLFDLVDATDDGEVHGVNKADYWKVVDQCYLCDLCYMTKCPYVPPHAWNLDFPHLMLRAKAIKFMKGRRDGREFLASDRRARPVRRHPDRRADGQRGSTAPAGARGVMESRARRGPDAWMPELATRAASAGARRSRQRQRGDQRRAHAGKVAIFSTCYVNYNGPASARPARASLAAQRHPLRDRREESCCGMPKLELGDLEGVCSAQAANIPVLAKYADGWAIVSAVPQCTLMFKQELPLMFPGRCRRAAGEGGDVRPFEYLDRAPQGRPAQDRFQGAAGQGELPHPCHGRVQNIGKKTEEMFKLIGRP